MKDQILNRINSFIDESEVQGKRILEAGSRNVNGSVRSIMEKYGPESYFGVDIEEGDGVDGVCNIYDLISEFGIDEFDIVVCTETLEHVNDWRWAVHNLKAVLKPGGILIFSAPIPGVKYHGYPFDFWRYSKRDCELIFRDMNIINMGYILHTLVAKMEKPLNFEEAGLSNIELHPVEAKNVKGE